LQLSFAVIVGDRLRLVLRDPGVGDGLLDLLHRHDRDPLLDWLGDASRTLDREARTQRGGERAEP
jgi:hypothetical protein